MPLARDFLVQLLETFAKDLIRLFPAGKANNAKARRQIAVGSEIIKGWDQLSMRQITGRTKNH